MNDDNFVFALKDFFEYAFEKGLQDQLDFSTNVILSLPTSKFVDWMDRYCRLVEMENNPNFGLTRQDFVDYAERHLRFELDDIDPEAFEAMVNEWIEKNLDKNAKICKEVWQSEFGKAQRKLNGLVAEMTALKSEHNSSVFNIDF